MAIALRNLWSHVTLSLTRLGRYLGNRGRRPPMAPFNEAKWDRLEQAEAEGDVAFLDRALAKVQPTSESLRGTPPPAPTDGVWPEEDREALFGAPSQLNHPRD